MELLTLIDLFDQNDITLISITEKIDTKSPLGKFFIGIIGAVAQLERSTIKERTAAGIKAAKERGVRFGRPRGMSEETKGKIKEAYRLYTEGKYTLNEITRKLKVSKKTISPYLRKEGRKQLPD